MSWIRTTTSTGGGTRRVPGRGTPRNTDVDELLTAVRHGLLTPEKGEQAVHAAVSAIDGLSRHDYDLNRWLADNGMALTWR